MSRTASARALAVAMLAGGLGSIAHGGMQMVTFDDIDFDGVTTTVSGDAYAAQGIVFSRAIPVGRVEALDPVHYDCFLELGGTALNGLTLKSGLGYSIDASFFVPGTSIAATTDWVSVLFYDTNVNTTLGRLEAFGLDGTLLGSIYQTTPAELGMVYTLGIPGIHRIRLTVDGDGGVADNIAFLSVPEVPAPATLALLSGAGLPGTRRRRRA